MEDNLKLLFESIRKQDAVLWVGAGFSMYAKYKSGKELSEKFYNMIDSSKRGELNPYDLQKVTQAYIDLNPETGRKKLIDNLKNEYINKVPASNKYHRTLANIPHIKTVITTNYDKLLEDCYKNKAQLIYRDNDISTIDERKVQIIKIHGDLKEPENIILTKDDYSKFFLSSKEKNIWTLVSERIATKTQVFLGYSLEDINVDYILDKIWSNIDNKKQCYLVAPNLSEIQIARLNNRSITYINLTGEGFIDKLYENIKKNIVSDVNNQNVAPDVYHQFMSKYPIATNIESSREKFKISSFHSPDKNAVLQGNVNFTIKNEASVNDFTDFLTGKILNEVTIPIENFSFNAHSILLAKSDSDTEAFFVFKRTPKEYIVDVRFKETSFERTEIPVKFVLSESNAECTVDLKQGKLIVKMQNEEPAPLRYQLTAQHNLQYGNAKDEIEYFTFLLNLYSGNEFTTYLKKEAVYTNKGIKDQKILEFINFHIQYFEKLKRIENHFNFQFENFDLKSLDKVSNTYVNNLIAIIDNKPIEYFYDDILCLDFKGFNESVFATVNGDLTMQNYKFETITLYGKLIELGYRKIVYVSMYPINLESVSSENSMLKLKSKDKRVDVTYLKQLPEEDLNLDISKVPMMNVSTVTVLPTE